MYPYIPFHLLVILNCIVLAALHLLFNFSENIMHIMSHNSDNDRQNSESNCILEMRCPKVGFGEVVRD